MYFPLQKLSFFSQYEIDINSESFVKTNLSLQHVQESSESLQFKLSNLGPNKKTELPTCGCGSNKNESISDLFELL
jgi:hypothetical protein